MLSTPVTIIPVKTEHLSIKTKFYHSHSLVPSVVPGKEWVLRDYTPSDSMNEGVQVTAVFYLEIIHLFQGSVDIFYKGSEKAF